MSSSWALVLSALDVLFISSSVSSGAEDVSKTNLCGLRFTPQEIETLRKAIERDYYFEFFIEDIPFGGHVGKIEETNLIPHTHKNYLYTTLDITIYHDDSSVSDVTPSFLIKSIELWGAIFSF
jgi:hypothetical protein